MSDKKELKEKQMEQVNGGGSETPSCYTTDPNKLIPAIKDCKEWCGLFSSCKNKATMM